jgi:hypothetical protein
VTTTFYQVGAAFFPVSSRLPAAILAPSRVILQDYAAPAEWGLSTLRDTVECIELGRSVVPADASTPIEWLASTVILTNALSAIEWRSSFTKDTGSLVEWRATPLIDIASSVEWRSSAILDASVPLDILQTISRDAAIPTEWLTSTTIFYDSSEAIEWRCSPFLDLMSPVEWRSSFVTDKTIPAEWRSSFVYDAIETNENLAAVLTNNIPPMSYGAIARGDLTSPAEVSASPAATISSPVEWRCSPSIDTISPFEWRSAFTVDSPSLTAWITTARFDINIPTEWGIAFTPVDFSFPIEPNATGQIDGLAPSDWRATLTPADTVISLEVPSGTARNVIIPNAFWLTTYHDEEIGINWTGPIGVTLTADSPLEWRSAPFYNTVIPVESSAMARSDFQAPIFSVAVPMLDSIGDVDISASTIADAGMPVLWTTISFTVTTSIPIFWVTATVIDVSLIAERVAGQQRDSSSVLAIGITTNANVSVASEWSGGITIAEDIFAGIEFRSIRIVDTRYATEWCSVAQSDVILNATWNIALVPIDYSTFAEWGQTTFSDSWGLTSWLSSTSHTENISLEVGGIIDAVIGDAQVPFEFGSLTLSEVLIGLDWSFTFPPRITKGAAVEAGLAAPLTKPIPEGAPGSKGATLER